MSYRRRLMLLAALAVSLAVVLASVVTYVSVRAQLRDSVDDGLRALADRVATAPVPSSGEPTSSSARCPGGGCTRPALETTCA